MLGSNRAEKLTRHALSKKNVSHILKDKNTNEEVKLKIKKIKASENYLFLT